jgi:hypothetical protein
MQRAAGFTVSGTISQRTQNLESKKRLRDLAISIFIHWRIDWEQSGFASGIDVSDLERLVERFLLRKRRHWLIPDMINFLQFHWELGKVQ